MFFAFSGTTQRFPPEPGCSLPPGKVKMPHWKPFTSFTNRPYHQLPEIMIGALPPMNSSPMASAFCPAESLAIQPFCVHSWIFWAAKVNSGPEKLNLPW